MRDLVEGALARRSLLKGGAIGAGTLVVGSLATATPAAAAGTSPGAGRSRTTRDVGRAAFTPVAPNRADAVANAPEFARNVVIRWGDPVEAGRARFDAHAPDAPRPRHGSSATTTTTSACCPSGRPPGAARGEPRVHQREPDVPGGPVRRRDDQEDRDGRSRHVRRHDRARTRPGILDPRRPPARPAQPPHHRAHRVRLPRPGRWPRRCFARPPIRRGRTSTARSTTAPAAPPRGAPCCPARRTSTGTSTPAAPSTRRTPRRSNATASPPQP